MDPSVDWLSTRRMSAAKGGALDQRIDIAAQSLALWRAVRRTLNDMAEPDRGDDEGSGPTVVGPHPFPGLLTIQQEDRPGLPRYYSRGPRGMGPSEPLQ